MTDPDRDPLAGLESVDWAVLHHAYGPATDVPGQLRALLSPDPEDRRRARHALSGNVYHQGTRWQASGHVVPFLAALAGRPETPERPAVLSLLRAVALGDRDDTDLPFDPRREFAVAETVTDADVAAMLSRLYGGGAEDGEEPEDVFEAVGVGWDRDAYRAAAAIAGRFPAWTEDPLVAAQAAELLAWFPATDAAVAALLAVPASGESAVARASANLTLAHSPAVTPEIDRLLTGLLASGVYGIRLTAAIALAFRLGDRLPDAALEALTEARDRAGEITADRFPVPWSRSLSGFAAAALYRIGLG